jgi:DNA replication protein DnaC
VSSTPSSYKTGDDIAENDMIVLSRDAAQYGGAKPPEPATCQFCGATLYHEGLLRFWSVREVFMWKKDPQRCTCPDAVEYWRLQDARQAELEEERARKIEEATHALIVEELYQKSGARGRFRDRNFQSFKETADNKTALKYCRRYADAFSKMRPRNGGKPEVDRNGIILSGGYGIGKTHLVTAIANQLIQAGTAVICMTMVELLERIKASYDEAARHDCAPREAEIMRQYEMVPLLIIDDLGSENPTEWGLSRLYAIVNARYEAYQPTIVTTNYDMEELIARLTPKGGDKHNATKTVDRLREMCYKLPMGGESWRGR